MKLSEHINEIALLGTEKRSVDKRILPAEILSVLDDKNIKNNESEFLETLCLVYYYTSAGQENPEYISIDNTQPTLETKAVANIDLQEAFRLLNNIKHFPVLRLLESWLDIMIKQQLLVHPTLIVPLLKLAKKTNKSLKSKVRQVIGEKGLNILPFFPAVNYEIEDGEDMNIWEEGKAKERIAFLITLRDTDVYKAQDLIKSSWESESIRDKKSILSVIRDTYKTTDKIFLEECLATEFAYQKKEKKTVQSCRAIIVETLLSSLESELTLLTVEQLKAYVKKGKSNVLSKLTHKSKNKLVIPEIEDEFWNANVMHEAYGYEKTNADITLFESDQQYWLSMFIKVLPIDAWSQILDLSESHVIKYFLTHKEYMQNAYGEVACVFTEVLMYNAKKFKNENVAAALLPLIEEKDQLELLQYLSGEKWEAFILENELYMSKDFLDSNPQHKNWTLSFSKNIIQKIFSRLEGVNQILDPKLGMIAANYIHPYSNEVVEECNRASTRLWDSLTWRNHFFVPVNTALKFRKHLEPYKQ